MRDLILCGNGRLLQYIKNEVLRDKARNVRLVIDNIRDIRSVNGLETSDILLGVSWYEAKKWIRALKEAGAEKIYRIPVLLCNISFRSSKTVRLRQRIVPKCQNLQMVHI